MRVIVYARVSTQKQDLSRQIRLAEEYCAPRKYQIVDRIVEKMSGAKSEIERDGLKRLMSLSKDDCDMVVVSELSRISREEEFQRIFSRIDTLRDNGISVVFLDDPDNIYSKENPITFVQFIMLGVRAQGAREELLKIRDRMKTGMRTKLKVNPYMSTGPVPFGFVTYANPDYVQGQTPKTLIRIDETQAAIIRRCYDMAISGSSCQSIADFLNNSGYISQRGKQWRANTVLEMLKNRIYIGERIITDITHKIEAIVTPEVFEQALKSLSQSRCMISKNEDRFNPLKGILYCGDCGLHMMLIRWHGHLVYRCCYHAYKNRGNREYKHCNNSLIHYDSIMTAVWNATVDRLKSDEYYGKSMQTVADYEQQMGAIEKTMSKLIRERKPLTTDLNKRIKQLETIDDADLLQLIQSSYKEIKAKIEALNEQIRACQKEHNKINMMRGELASQININNDMSVYEKAEFFNKTLDRVTYTGEHFKRSGVLDVYFKNGDHVSMVIQTKTK